MNKRVGAHDEALSKARVSINLPSEAATSSSERKRSPKIEVKYRGRIYLISGEKGGVGKTLTARSLIEIKRRAGFIVNPIEADAGNLDIEKLFKLDGHINLHKEGGYTDLLNYLEGVASDEDAVVSLPAGALAGAGIRGAGFLDGLPHLGEDLSREVVIVWPIDDKELSIVMLKDFIDRCPGMRIDVVGNHFFFNEFTIYDNSRTRKIIESNAGHFVSLPRLQPQVMQRLVNENICFIEALATFPIGARYELQRWIRLVEETFANAGYLTR